MTRYLYDDPLAAAWMADKFRMRLQKGEYGYGKGTFDLHGLLDATKDKAWRYRYYIHPDSVHLLIAQEGDLLLESDEKGGAWRTDEAWSEIYHPIIYRNGIAFMWPKVEE